MATKREYHCGFIPRTEWADPCSLPDRIGNAYCSVPTAVNGVTLCPGYLVRLPAVIESSRAFAAMKHGELSTVYPRPANAVVEGALEVAASFGAYESAMLAAARDKR